MSAVETSADDQETLRLKPLTFIPALAVFLGLGVWMRVCIYNLIPFLLGLGLHQFSAYLAGFIVGLSPFLPLALVFLKQEGHPLGRTSLAKRLGFQRFRARHFALMIGLTVLAYATTILASPTQTWFISLSTWIQPGDVFHPLQVPGSASDSLIESSVAWMGPDAAGYWAWVLAIIVLFIFNILGEELLWRGAIWPRQELIYGERTWLVHGFMWYLFHLPFYPWFVISGLPQALILSYLFQKTKNMWLVIIMHAIFNSVFYAILLMIVLGFVQ